MAIPLIKTCTYNLDDDDRLLILVDSSTTQKIASNAINLDERISIQIIGTNWAKSKLSILNLALRLRKKHPTLFLLPHSTNRFGITLFSMLVNASKTIIPYSKINSILFNTVRNYPYQHKVEYYNKFGEKGGLIALKKNSLAFEIPKNTKEEVRKLIDWNSNSNWIGFAPGSGIKEKFKRWPVLYFIKLGKILLEKQLSTNIILFGSPLEDELLYKIKGALNEFNNRIFIINSSDITIAAEAMKYCNCLVTACSGSSHIAAAMDIPIIALYGPTNPYFTGPYSKKTRIIRIGLKCSPCYRLGFNEGCSNPLCMTMISPEMIYSEIMKIINKVEFEFKTNWLITTKAKAPDLS